MMFWQSPVAAARIDALEPPQAQALAPWQDKTLQAALFALGLFLPYSTAGVSLAMAALLVLALCSARSVWALRPWREPTVAIGLVLIAYIAIHTLVSTGLTPRGGSAINKYQELLMLPVLFALFRLTSRPQVFIWGTAVGAVGYAIAYWFGSDVPTLEASFDQKRISAGFVLTVFSFVLVDLARTARYRWLWLSAAIILAATALFRVEGRTGHMVLLVLAGVAAWIYSPRKWRLVAIVAVPAVVLALAWASPAVQKRIGETWSVLRTARPDGETSTGIRIGLTASGFGVARENMPFGVGYARYAQAQEEFVQRRHGTDPTWQKAVGQPWVHIPNPHNEYLMQAAGGGAIPLLLFIAWLAAPMLKRRTVQPASALLPAVVLAFAVGCTVNSLLLDFIEGHFYVALLAWLLARESPGRAP
jgi:O-antigen ligase